MIQHLKAIKNSVELEGFRQCHIRDGAALVRILQIFAGTLNISLFSLVSIYRLA